jgi:hypothetical protein
MFGSITKVFYIFEYKQSCMKTINLVILLFMLVASYVVKAQCNVQTEMNANGTISKTTDQALIYSNETYSMFSQMKYDGIDYYFVWVVKPVEKKKVESESMVIELDNDSAVLLEFYDSFKTSRDSSMNILYKISNPNVEQLCAHAIKQINVNTGMGPKNFILVLHKDQVRDQLKCLIAEKKKE